MIRLGFLIAVIGWTICPIWHQIDPPRIHHGYLVGLAVVALGGLLMLGGVMRGLRLERQGFRGDPRRRRRLLFALPALTLIALYLIMEVTASAYLQLAGQRMALREFRLTQRREGEAEFISHPFLGWVKDPGLEGVNSLGFYGPEWSLEKSAGTLRVACLGGSTTEDGYPARMTPHLRARLGERPIEVMNFGTRAWTSAHNLVNYSLNARHYEPDVVLLHMGANDYKAAWSEPARTDYSHIFKTMSRPPPAADHFLVRYLNSYALAKWRFAEAAGRPTTLALEETVMRVPHQDAAARDRFPEVLPIFRENLAALARMAREDGAIVLLMTQPHSRVNTMWSEEFLEYMPQANGVIRDVAAELDVRLIDLDQYFVGNEDIFADPLHLTDEGIEEKARGAAAAIGDALEGAGKAQSPGAGNPESLYSPPVDAIRPAPSGSIPTTDTLSTTDTLPTMDTLSTMTLTNP